MSKASVGSAVIVGFLVLMGLTGLASYRRVASLDARVDQSWQQVLAAYENQDALSSPLATDDPEASAIVTDANEALQRAESISSPNAAELAVFAERQAAVDQWLDGKAISEELRRARRAVVASRQAFNDDTLAYNRARRRFPTVLIALAAGFSDRPYLDAPTAPDTAEP